MTPGAYESPLFVSVIGLMPHFASKTAFLAINGFLMMSLFLRILIVDSPIATYQRFSATHSRI